MTSRHWCFTAWKVPTLSEVEDITCVTYLIYQEEMAPETKKKHWQGYAEFKSPVRIAQLKKVLTDTTLHAEKRLGTRTQAREYCMKKESAVGVPMEFGTWKEDREGQGRRSDLEAVHEDVKKGASLQTIVENHYPTFVRYHRGIERANLLLAESKIPTWRDVKVWTFIGPPGCGKTRKVYEGQYGSVYALLGCSPLWFDGYQGQECLLIDDFDGSMDYRTLLRVLDGHKMQVPIKGGSVWAQWKNVCITSNIEPDKWYDAAKWDEGALRRRLATGGTVTMVNSVSRVTEVVGNTQATTQETDEKCLEDLLSGLEG